MKWRNGVVVNKGQDLNRSRRNFLKLVGGVGAGLALAACGKDPGLGPGPRPTDEILKLTLTPSERYVLENGPKLSELKGGMYDNYNLAKFLPEKDRLDAYFAQKDPVERMLMILYDNPPQAANDDRTELLVVPTWQDAGGRYWCNSFAQKIAACYLYPKIVMSTFFDKKTGLPVHVSSPYDKVLASGGVRENDAIMMFNFFMNQGKELGWKRIKGYDEANDFVAKGGIIYGVKNWTIDEQLGQEPDRNGHNFIRTTFLSQATDVIYMQKEEESSNPWKFNPEYTVKVNRPGGEEEWPKVFYWGYEFVK